MTGRFIWLLLPCLLSPFAQADDWRGFRGTDFTGYAPDSQLPTEFGTAEGSDREKNIAWKVDVPGEGLSSPLVVDGRVYLTASSGADQDRLHLLSYDAKTGGTNWHRQFWATGRGYTHSKSRNATPTPVTDGQRLFAFFSSGDLICLDREGRLIWYRGLGADYPNASNSLGLASSPVIAGDTLVVPIESDADSLALGIDTATGVTRWQIPRPEKSNWSSPLVLNRDKPHPVVVLPSSEGAVGIDPQSGETVWEYAEAASTMASPSYAGQLLIIPSDGLVALRPGDPNPEVVWKQPKLNPSSASPLVRKDKLFTVNRAGVLTCGSVADGRVLWQLRLKGPFWASPVADAAHLYLFNDGGRAFVIEPSETEGRIVFETDFANEILATPSVAGNALYVRTHRSLWKIADSAE